MLTSLGSLLPAVLAVAITFGPGPDSTSAKLPGYGGVLPLPFAADDAALLLSPAEIIAPRHTERRTERGRILYANDRAPKAAPSPGEPVRTARLKRPPCTTTSSLLQSRASAQPNG